MERDIRPVWKGEANEALKTQFASQLHDPYLAAMAHNLLKTQGQNMNFPQFQAECISMFGSQIKAPKMKIATNSVSLSGALKEQKTHFQKKNVSKDKKIQAQMELIEQKWEIENLKATPLSTTNSGKKFMGTPRPPKPPAGVDGSLDNNLTCQYCKDTRHELEN